VTPCIHCSGEGKLMTTQYSGIRADRMPIFGKSVTVRCAECGAETEIFGAEAPAIEAWDRGDARYWKRGFRITGL
jgi:hypothetical protein